MATINVTVSVVADDATEWERVSAAATAMQEAGDRIRPSTA